VGAVCLEILKEGGVLFTLWDAFLVMKGKTKVKLVLMSYDEMSVFVKQQYISALLCNNKLGNYFAPLWRHATGTALGQQFFLIRALSHSLGLCPLTFWLGNPTRISLGCCLPEDTEDVASYY